MRNPFRRREEQRAVTSLPWDVGGPVGVGHVSVDRALSLAPVYSATSLISASVSTLPICSYRMVGASRRPNPVLPELFARMRDAGTLQPWLHRCMSSLLLRGNAYGLIYDRDTLGFPTGIEWVNPEDISVIDQMPVGRGSFRLPTWYWRGRELPTENLVHIVWYALPGRVQGLSPIGAFAATISGGLFIQDYGNSWFEGGGFPPGTFKNVNNEVPQDVAEAMGARLDRARRRRRPLVYGKDWEYKPISVPPNEAQFIESAGLNNSTIAGIYHLPPEKVGGETSRGLRYSSAEMDQIDVAQFGIRPWVEVLEAAFYALIPEGQYVKFEVDALVRTDLKTQHEVYEIDLRTGVRTVDEIRAKMDLPPLPKPATPTAPAATPPGAAPAMPMPNGNGPARLLVPFDVNGTRPN